MKSRRISDDLGGSRPTAWCAHMWPLAITPVCTSSTINAASNSPSHNRNRGEASARDPPPPSSRRSPQRRCSEAKKEGDACRSPPSERIGSMMRPNLSAVSASPRAPSSRRRVGSRTKPTTGRPSASRAYPTHKHPPLGSFVEGSAAARLGGASKMARAPSTHRASSAAFSAA